MESHFTSLHFTCIVFTVDRVPALPHCAVTGLYTYTVAYRHPPRRQGSVISHLYLNCYAALLLCCIIAKTVITLIKFQFQDKRLSTAIQYAVVSIYSDLVDYPRTQGIHSQYSNSRRAIPVKLSQLIAHLEAYQETKATINTLRLCNRFGRGTNAKITDLPIDLVKSIEHEILRGPRARGFEHWERAQGCGENRCDPLAHFDYLRLGDFAEECFCDTSLSPTQLSHLKKTCQSYLRGDSHCDCPVHQNFRAEIMKQARDYLEDFGQHRYDARASWEDAVAVFLDDELVQVDYTHSYSVEGHVDHQ